MWSDSDLGPATLLVRDQVLHCGHVTSRPTSCCPNSEARPGPSRPAVGLTSDTISTSHVPPRGHVTITHDSLAAKKE
jgi:hypothetical protein